MGNLYPPHHFGGYELIWRGAVEHLRDSGHEIRILTTDHRHPSPDPAIPEDPDCHRELRWYWREHEFPRISPRARLRLERHNARVLERHLDEWSPDLVAWWPMGGMSLSLVERVHRAGLPSVAVVMDDWPTLRPQGRCVAGAALPAPAARPARRAADGRPVLGRPRLAHALDLHQPAPARADRGRARCRCRARASRTQASTSELFRQAPEHPWRWRLLYCGRIDPRKGIDLAVAALPLLPDEATLRVVGDGDAEHREELERQARELGVSDRVHFERVDRDRLPQTFAEHDVLLFPVRWPEPWGLVPLEAMAVGLLVVASGRGGSAEYLDDGANCLLADPDGGAEPLAAALRRLADEPELRARLRAGGLATAGRYPDTAFASAVADMAAETAAAA